MASKRNVNPAEATIDVDAASPEDLQKLKEGTPESPASDTPKVAPVAAKVDAATETAKAPDAKETAPAVDEDGEPISDTVPHGRYEHERKRRKDAETKARDAEEKRIRLEERTNALLQVYQQASQQTQQKTQPAEPPKRDENPLAYLDYIDGELTSLKKAVSQRQQEDQTASAWGQAYTAYNADIQRVSQQKPDFRDAMAHLVNSRHQELEIFGVHDPVAKANDINAMERQIITYAMQNRTSPAEILYGLAAQRGYRAAAPVAAVAQNPPAINPASVVQQVQQRETTRQAATSLSGSGAPVATGDIGPEQLLEMTDAEFADFKKKYGDRAMGKAFGLH